MGKKGGVNGSKFKVKTGRLFWQGPNYRALQAQIKRHFSEKSHFPIQFRKRESSQENPYSLPQIHLVSAATWGGHAVRQQAILQAFVLLAVPLQRWEKYHCHLILQCGAKTEPALCSRCTNPHGRNCRTLLKTLTLSEYDRFEFCSPSWGLSWQPFIALKHSFMLPFIEIIYRTRLHARPLIH